MNPLYQETRNLLTAIAFAATCWWLLSWVLIIYPRLRQSRPWTGRVVLLLALSPVAWLPPPWRLLWLFPAVTLAVMWATSATLEWWGRARNWGFLPVTLLLMAVSFLTLHGMVDALDGIHLAGEARVFFMHGMNMLSWPVAALLAPLLAPNELLPLALEPQAVVVTTVLDHFPFVLTVANLGVGYALVRFIQPAGAERISYPTLPRWYVPVWLGLSLLTLGLEMSAAVEESRLLDMATVLGFLSAFVAVQGWVLLWRQLRRRRGVLLAWGVASAFLPALALLFLVVGAADAVLSLQPLLARDLAPPRKQPGRLRPAQVLLLGILPAGLIALLLLYGTLYLPQQPFPDPTNLKGGKHEPTVTASYRVVEKADSMALWVGRDARFWMDRYEFPNREGQRPRLTTRITTARELCREQGKALCDWPQWHAVCMSDPYRVGNRPRNEAPKQVETEAWKSTFGQCHVDDPGGAAWPSGANPGCRIGGGVYDLLGNVWELVDVSGPPGLVAIVGGSFRYHSEDLFECSTPFFLTPDQLRQVSHADVGFRCCRPASQP